MSRSLAEERDRLQRQIEELEQNLGEAPVDLDQLSSDTSSDDGSDDEIQMAEPSHQVPSSLLAQKEQIQQEIEELQTALQAQNAICPSDEDSSDSGESAEELDIPETEEGCLQVNLVYQQVLIDSLNHLERLLNQNRCAQKELLFQMTGPTRDAVRDYSRVPTSYQQPTKMYLGRFHKPYFKDKLTGLGPPANMETKDRTNRMTTTLDDKRLQMKRWEGWHKTLLINSVAKDSLKNQIKPKLSKVDYLSQKMSSARAEDKVALKEQIEQLEKDIQHLRSQKEKELVGDRFDDHDWQKISNIDFEGLREAEDLRQFWRNFLHPSVNKSSWTPEEIKRLAELSAKHRERNWESIAEELGTGRTAFMCIQTYQRYVSKTLKRSGWTAEEDELLRELVEKMRIGNFIPYTQMSYFMEGHDPSQLTYRWSQVLDPSLRKGPWSKEEDQALLRAVAHFGERNWSKMRLEVPGRSDGACRDRYIDCLKAGTKRGPFDMQERELLVQLVKKHGVGRWAKIAAEIPNRIDAQCLREWKKFVKHEAREATEVTEVKKKKKVKKKLPARICAIKEEEEEEELADTSEEEQEEGKEKVVYMDSDDEKMKHIVEEEMKLMREEEEREQKKELEEEEAKPQGSPEEGPPGTTESPTQENQDAIGTFIYQVVERPVFGPAQRREPVVRTTLADADGNVRDTLVTLKPRVLSRGARHSPLAMLQVSCLELYSFLVRRSTYMRSGRGRGRGRSASQRQPPHSGKRRRLSSMNNLSMDYRLMAAVTPWIGNLLVPDPTWDEGTGAYALRQRMQGMSITSTPVFRLFLQVLRVDAMGCKDVIEKREQEGRPRPHLRTHKPRPNSVLGLLDKKHTKAQELKEPQQIGPQLVQIPAQQPLLPQAPHSPQIRWMLAPQATPRSPSAALRLRPRGSPGAPPNRHPAMRPVIPPQMAPLRFPGPTVFLTLPNLQPGPSPGQQNPGAAPRQITPAMSPSNALLPGQARPSLTPLSAAAAGSVAEPAALSKLPLAPPPKSAAACPINTKGAKRRRGKEPPPGLSADQSSAGETQEVKRVRRMTAKAKALEEVAQAKTKSKCNRSQKRTPEQIGQAGPPASPDGSVLPLGDLWVMTPNGLVPLVGVLPPGVKIALPPRHQNQIPPSNVFLQPLPPCPPMPPTNTHHQASSPYRQQSTNSTPIAPPSVSTIHPPSVSTIQPPSVSTIQPPSVSTIQPPSVSTIQPPSVSTIQPPSVSTIQPPSVSTIQPPSVSTIQPPSVCTIQPPSVSPIQPPSVSTIKPPSVSTIQPPSVSPIQPPSVSTIQPPSVSPIQPPSVCTIQPPSVSPIQPPSVSTVPSLHHLGHPHPLRPQWTQGPVRPVWRSGGQPLIASVLRQSTVRAPPPVRQEALQFDPALMFCEPAAEVRRWLSGAGGAAAPGLGVALPYLPPFASSLETLHTLLASKKRLSEMAFRLLPTDTLTDLTPSPGPDHQYSLGSSGEEASEPVDPDRRRAAMAQHKVAAVRKLVAKHCAASPAYQMLKARFLSCFTVPALLATITPDQQQGVLKTVKRARKNSPLLQEGDGRPATHFSGITTHRPLETKNTSQDSSQSGPGQTPQNQARPNC